MPMPSYNHPSLQELNNPYSMRPFPMTSPLDYYQALSRGIGLTGLDPKFINDPRFDYVQRLTSHLPETQPGYGVLMGNPQRDDYDSAPINARSRLAVDQPTREMQGDMDLRSVGPSPWFLQNRREIMGNAANRPSTPQQAEEMRRRILMTRDRIEDRY